MSSCYWDGRPVWLPRWCRLGTRIVHVARWHLAVLVSFADNLAVLFSVGTNAVARPVCGGDWLCFGPTTTRRCVPWMLAPGHLSCASTIDAVAEVATVLMC